MNQNNRVSDQVKFEPLSPELKRVADLFFNICSDRSELFQKQTPSRNLG